MSAGKMRTPLGRVRGLGSAKSGTEHFWRQRLTVMMLLGRNHAAVIQILGSPLITIIMLLFVASVTYHMRLGMQVVIEDYVHDEVSKLILLMANTFFTIAIGVVCAFALLKISFGV
jgi:succinate dehydrogenase / fumarate reductase membrane anchor subunit